MYSIALELKASSNGSYNSIYIKLGYKEDETWKVLRMKEADSREGTIKLIKEKIKGDRQNGN